MPATVVIVPLGKTRRTRLFSESQRPPKPVRILDATRELLAEGGVRGLTIEGVAARSGVAKIDDLSPLARPRRARARGCLERPGQRASSAIGRRRHPRGAAAFVEPVITVVQSPLMSNVIRGLTSEIAGSSELSRTYRERIVDPRLEQLRLVVARGVERGDLRPDTDLRLAHELLLGPVFYRLLYSGQPLDDGLGRARGLRRPARLRSRVIAATARRARAGPALNRARDPVGPALDAAIRCRTMRRILGRPGGGGDSGPDFSRVDSREKAEQLVGRGELARLHLVPTEFGGSDDVRNLVYVPPFVVELKQQTDANVVVPLIEEGRVRSYAATPRYEGASFVPSSIEIRASDPEDFAASLRIWGAALDDA